MFFKSSFKLFKSLCKVLKLTDLASSEGAPVFPHRAAPRIPFSELDHISDALYEAPKTSLENKAR